eukprot:6379851-Prymnesium_polylepis.1
MFDSGLKCPWPCGVGGRRRRRQRTFQRLRWSTRSLCSRRIKQHTRTACIRPPLREPAAPTCLHPRRQCGRVCSGPPCGTSAAEFVQPSRRICGGTAGACAVERDCLARSGQPRCCVEAVHSSSSHPVSPRCTCRCPHRVRASAQDREGATPCRRTSCCQPVRYRTTDQRARPCSREHSRR